MEPVKLRLLDWIDIKMERPALGRKVLVRGVSGTMDVMSLYEQEAIVVGSLSATALERKVKIYFFYPGGLPIENVSHWAALFGPDGEEPR